MELYFLRHGDPGPRDSWKGSDASRPLTADGATAMQREADMMARLGISPGLVLTSPLVRARQTAEIVAGRLGLAERLQEDERLAPGFGAAELEGVLHDHGGQPSLLLVGHEPDFSRVVSACIGGGEVECRKGALARVDLKNPRSPRGVLTWLLPPQILAGP